MGTPSGGMPAAGRGRPPASVWNAGIRRQIQDGVVVVSVRGRLGSRAAPALADALAAAAGEAGGRIVLDLEGLDYISSPALRTLRLEAERCRQRGGGLVLCHVDEAVRIGIELTGMLDLVDACETREQAVAAASQERTGRALRPADRLRQG